MKKINKKGQIDALQPLIIALVVVGIVLVVAFLIFDQIRAQATVIEGADTYSTNATDVVIAATDDIPGWLPIIIVVVIGALLIGLVNFLRRSAT